VLLVDALDECDKPSDWEDLLKFLRDVISENVNVSLICSLHAHVIVDKILAAGDKPVSPDVIVTVNVNEQRNISAVNAYIDGELERRRAEALTCIFCRSNSLSRRSDKLP
jgi:hypothetical protein